METGGYSIVSDTLKLTEPVKTGYKFSGWKYEGTTEVLDEIKIEKGSTGDVSIVAVWESNKLTVQNDSTKGSVSVTGASVNVWFDLDGGTWDKPCFYNVKKGQIFYGQTSIPTKEGYVFAGWYNGESLYSFTSALDSDIQLTAKWLKIDKENAVVVNMGKYNSSSNMVDISNANEGCSKIVYVYLTCLQTGDFTIYYKNSNSAQSYSVKMTYYTITYRYGSFSFSQESTSKMISNTSVSSTACLKISGTAGYIYRLELTPTNEYYDTVVSLYFNGTGSKIATTNQYYYGNLSTNINISPNEKVYLKATPRTGYSFAGWYIGDELLSAEIEYEYSMPDSSVNIQTKWTES